MQIGNQKSKPEKPSSFISQVRKIGRWKDKIATRKKSEGFESNLFKKCP